MLEQPVERLVVLQLLVVVPQPVVERLVVPQPVVERLVVPQ